MFVKRDFFISLLCLLCFNNHVDAWDLKVNYMTVGSMLKYTPYVCGTMLRVQENDTLKIKLRMDAIKILIATCEGLNNSDRIDLLFSQDNENAYSFVATKGTWNCNFLHSNDTNTEQSIDEDSSYYITTNCSVKIDVQSALPIESKEGALVSSTTSRLIISAEREPSKHTSGKERKLAARAQHARQLADSAKRQYDLEREAADLELELKLATIEAESQSTESDHTDLPPGALIELFVGLIEDQQ